jgi:hypothetical protein
MLGLFNKEIARLKAQNKELQQIIHYQVHGLPKPSKLCGKIAYITVSKHDNGEYGLTYSGMLSSSEVIWCLMDNTLGRRG